MLACAGHKVARSNLEGALSGLASMLKAYSEQKAQGGPGVLMTPFVLCRRS